MMQEPKHLRVIARWNWGGAQIIDALSSDQIGETLAEFGFSALAGTRLIIAHNGKVIDPSFSFGYYNTTNGSKFVLLLKKLPSKERSRKFLESMEKRDTIQYFKVTRDPTEITRREEIARLNDLALMTWESLPDFPLIMKEIINSQEKQSAESWLVRNNNYETVIPESSKISEDPLPNLFEKEKVGAPGLFKNDFGLGSSFMADPFAGNNGVCEKKH
ncbi:hypothetical protein TRFO_17640 [Tritrichomonas foetus]|uniref:Uncharacterized protein n=1 Tax=Tritrichomonas foetus TaxID=1144522 RepID=A0A1J4KS43_9EUKA|nr:hypothetical protein TRFO_17640 [Tritrichomonas foetus]|eukprot:OHT12486.1 hypothetical protein TRFO_17640 [Tritrichomonas foetus]